MERMDWTLLAIAAAAPKSLDPVQLQKCLFLLGRNCPQVHESPFYDFQPYNYGPFDVQIYQDAEQLDRQGLISIQRPAWRKWGDYLATAVGIAKAATLRRERATPEVWEYLTRLVTWARALSFEDLIKTICEHYPEYRANSVFPD